MTLLNNLDGVQKNRLNRPLLLVQGVTNYPNLFVFLEGTINRSLNLSYSQVAKDQKLMKYDKQTIF